MQRADVIVLGGGLVGLTLAIALDRHGLGSIVVDPRTAGLIVDEPNVRRGDGQRTQPGDAHMTGRTRMPWAASAGIARGLSRFDSTRSILAMLSWSTCRNRQPTTVCPGWWAGRWPD